MDCYAKPELDSPELHPLFTYPVRRPPVIFTHKRFALAAGRIARALASLAGPHMTPARLDVLLKLMDGPMLQRDLCLEIGVVPSVLSRMLEALERLGHVTRVKWEEDKRYRMVTITESGRAAFGTLFDGHIADDSMSGGIQADAESSLAAAWALHFDREGISASLPCEVDKRDFLRRMTHAERQTRYVDQWFNVALGPEAEIVPPLEHAAKAAATLGANWREMQREWRKWRIREKDSPGWPDLRKTRDASPAVLRMRRSGLLYDTTQPLQYFK